MTGDEPAHAYGHNGVQPHYARYAIAAAPPETNRTIMPIVGASLRPGGGAAGTCRGGRVARRRPGARPSAAKTQSASGVGELRCLRRQQAPNPLLMRAEEPITNGPVLASDVFVHGDLGQGNALWIGDVLVGLVDWDCVGAGPAAVDLGSLRCRICFGIDAAEDVHRGWEDAAGC
jgi:hypothetical protein